MRDISINVAEVIPYKNINHMIEIVKQEYNKGRYTEVWDGYVYSARRWRRC